MKKIALVSTLLSCGNGLSHLRQNVAGRSDGWIVRQLGTGGDRENDDSTTITLRPHMSSAGAGSKKAIEFFSIDDENVMFSFECVEGEDDVIKIHRLPKSAAYSRKLFETEASEEEKTTSIFLLTNFFLVFLCVLTAALAAGLTMGLLSLDPLSLEIKRRTSPSMEERKWSSTLLPLLLGHSKRHRLMVSLLLMNAIANEALPLFIDDLLGKYGKYASILVSVTMVLFFGEIVPSAFFTGPNQVEVSAKLVPLVKVVMAVLSPVAVPIAKLLDRILHNGADEGGHDDEDDVTEGNYMNRGELGALVRIQYEAQLADQRRRKRVNQKLLRTLPVHHSNPRRDHSNVSTHSSSDSSQRHTHHTIREIANEITVAKNSKLKKMLSIHEDEITMIEGALAMTVKVAADVCTPLRRVYALPCDTILDEATCVSIWSRGFSRIPIYHKPDDEDSISYFGDDISGIVGVLLSRQLIVINPNEERPLATVPLVLPPCIPVSMHLVDLINMFQAAGGRGKGGLHLAIVCARPDIASEALERGESIPKDAGVVGIVTLEDVVEELLQEEIYDEADRDLELSRWTVTKWKQFVKRKRASRSNAVAALTEATPLL
ncbi:hypothetical protein ACHAXM_001183 [Skeletonema potamos]